MDVRRRRSLLFAVLVVIVGAVVAVVLVSVDSGDDRGAAPPSATPTPTAPTPAGRAVAEICVVNAPDAHEVCARRSEDRQRRQPLTGEQEAEIEQVSRLMVGILPPLPEAGQVCEAPPGPCRFDHASLDQAYVDATRSALTGAGYPDAVLRLARPDDPAPEGSLVYGIPVGAGCVVGYHGPNSGGDDELGRLPDGGCLTP